MPTFKLFSDVNRSRKKEMPNYLEIDSKILEKNLLLKNDSPDADNLESFFRSPENYIRDNAAWKIVTPAAGFCLKTVDSKNKKVFINVCKLDDIPAPREVTESELLEIWQSDDVPDYRIPLSIQEPHDEFDKSGNPTVAYDVAVNTKFFEKIHSSMVFRSFVMQVVMEGIESKYGIEIKKEGYVILQNRKSLGELKPHRIRKSKLPGGSSKPLIEELNSSESVPSSSKDDKKTLRKHPKFRFYENNREGFVVGEFHLPHLITHEDLVLYTNDDRIVLESRRGSYSADFFIPLRVKESETTAFYDVATNILAVRMPTITTPI